MTRASKLDLPLHPRILVITLRRLGDVLLTTPLVRNIRRGFPDACLDMLVFRGSDAILAGNPDIDHVLTMAERPSIVETSRSRAPCFAATILSSRRRRGTGRPSSPCLRGE